MRRRGRPGGAAARRTVALVACLLLAVVTGCGGNRPGPTGSTESVVSSEATQDDPRPDLYDPTTQRNLSDDGRDQARQLGRAIRRLGIPVGTVLASP